MAREENSLLFSLKEVANTLQDRLKEEEDSRAAAVEAERRAKEDAIRRVKEEEEAKTASVWKRQSVAPALRPRPASKRRIFGQPPRPSRASRSRSS